MPDDGEADWDTPAMSGLLIGYARVSTDEQDLTAGIAAPQLDPPVGMSTPERVHAHREGRIGLGGVLASLPVLWVNHPGRSADAVYKPLQLAVAAGCGLRVPRTLISNSTAAAHRFAGQSATGAVIKMLGAGTIHEDHSRKISFTHRLTGGDLDDLAGFDVTCHQMQDWVPKSREASPRESAA